MKQQKIALPNQLWTSDSIDLTSHRYQGKLLKKADGLALGKHSVKPIHGKILRIYLSVPKIPMH